MVDELIQQSNWDCLDLNDYKIGYYDYEHLNKDDDYLPLMTQVLEKYDNHFRNTSILVFDEWNNESVF